MRRAFASAVLGRHDDDYLDYCWGVYRVRAEQRPITCALLGNCRMRLRMSGLIWVGGWECMANNARRRRDGGTLVAWQRQKVACMRCTAHARLGALCALPRVCATRRRRGAVRSGVRPCRALNSKYSRKSQSSLGTVIGHSEDPCRRLRVSASLDLHTVSLPGSSVCGEGYIPS